MDRLTNWIKGHLCLLYGKLRHGQPARLVLQFF